MLLLHRWAFMSTPQGGLHSSKDRQAVVHLVESIISSVTNIIVKVPLLLLRSWACTWPRPFNWQCAVCCNLQIVNGFMDLTPMAAIQGEEGKLAKLWLDVIVGGGSSGNLTVSVHHAFMRMLGVASMGAMYAQCVWHVCQAIDSQLFKSYLGLDKDAPVSVNKDTRWFKNQRVMHALLVKYMSASVSASKGHQFFFLCSDKGHVGCYPLQNTLLTYNSNVAVMAPPAAPSGGKALRGALRVFAGCKGGWSERQGAAEWFADLDASRWWSFLSFCMHLKI
jgi:hypothetical protein